MAATKDAHRNHEVSSFVICAPLPDKYERDQENGCKKAFKKYYLYDKVVWSVDKNGIPIYALLGENNQKIKIDTSKFLN